MRKYERLLDKIHKEDIEIVSMNFKGTLKGLYADNVIAIDSKIDSVRELNGVLSEELGHHHTTTGNILDKKDIRKVKQEKRARNWGYEDSAGIIDIVNAYNKGARNRYELAEYLEITEQYLEEAIQHYKEKYGLFFEIDNYIVRFEPTFGIIKKF